MPRRDHNPKTLSPNETSLTVKNEDIVEYSSSEALTDAFGAWAFGVFAFLPLSVGTGLFNALLLFSPSLILVVWVTVGFVLAFLTYYVRPTILQSIFVGRDFQKAFGQYRAFVIWSYALAIILAAFGLTFLYSPTIKWTSAGLVLAGLSYFAMVPAFTTRNVLKPDNEARLSILQFLRGSPTGNPDYSWLRRGLRRIENRIPRIETIGVSVSRDSLFLGCRYRTFTGMPVDPDLMVLSDWVVNPAQSVNPSIERLLRDAREARTLELSPVPTVIDRVLGLSRFAIPFVIPITAATLALLGVSPSVFQDWQDFLSKFLL